MPLLLATAYVMITKNLQTEYSEDGLADRYNVRKIHMGFLHFHDSDCGTVLGNMLPVPFIIIFIKKVFAWLRLHWPWMNAVVTRLEKRAESKSDVIERYGPWGLLLFVAIPAPGTGAWTGALIAALLNMTMKQAIPIIFVGVCIAGIIVTGITYGVIRLV